MSHLLICGAAGYTNVGDDAILLGMLPGLRAVLGSGDIRVAGGPGLGALLRPSEAVSVSYQDRAELARAVEEADLVALGGGGLLYDVGYEAGLHRLLGEPPDRQWLYELARIAAAAAAAGRPAMLYAVGVGPLTTAASRAAAKFICEHVAAVTVRDDASAELLADCGAPRSRLHIAADPAVLIEPADATLTIERLGLAGAPHPWVAVNIRPWGTDEEVERLTARAAAFARGVRDRLGGTAVLVPMQRSPDDDLPLLERLAESDGRALVLRETPAPPELAGLLGRCDAVLGMRLHSLVLAVAAGAPFVALAYDEKIGEFARLAGLAEHAQLAGEFDPERALESCQALMGGDLAAGLLARRGSLREAAMLPAAIAGDIIRARRPGMLVGQAGLRQPPGATRRRATAIPPGPPAAEIRVLMRIRPDARERPGGDTVQMDETRLRLEALGVRVAVSHGDAPDASGYGVVHAFNLGRPEEPFRHCLEAAQAGVPVALSTVYWDFSEFWEWGDPDYWELPEPGDGLPEPRPAPQPDPVEARRRAWLDLVRRAAIECADAYLPNGQGEAELLNREYGLDLTRTVVVTNAVDERYFSASPESFVRKHGVRDFVLCAARVEKRKNQLALVSALRGTGLPLVIVGQPNPPEYLDLCRQYADGNVTFIEALPHDELAGAYAAAKVHALPGWFETPGLSTLEAAAAGCAVVSTDRGTAREYLGDLAHYCDPRSIGSIRRAVLTAYEAPRSGELQALVRERYTWERAAESTLEGYRLALWLHRRRDAAERAEAALRALRTQADVLARLAADRAYQADRMRQWAESADAELRRLQAEFGRLTSRRLHRWSAAAARAGWSLLRLLGVKP